MKSIKVLALGLLALVFSSQAIAANANTIEKKTAEDVYAYANTLTEFDEATIEALKLEINGLNDIQRVKLFDMAMKDINTARAEGLSEPEPIMYILAILIPPVAVGLHTDWGMPTVWNVVWCLFGYVPGIVHAFIVLTR